MGHTNRRADGDGLSSELHERSAAGTCRNPRGSTARGFLEASGIPFVQEGEDVKHRIRSITRQEDACWHARWILFITTDPVFCPRKKAVTKNT